MTVSKRTDESKDSSIYKTLPEEKTGNPWTPGILHDRAVSRKLKLPARISLSILRACP